MSNGVTNSGTSSYQNPWEKTRAAAVNFFGKIYGFPLDFSTLVFELKLKGGKNWLKSAKKLIIFAQNARISAQKALKNAHFCNFPLLHLCSYFLSTYIVFWRNSHPTKCPIRGLEKKGFG